MQNFVFTLWLGFAFVLIAFAFYAFKKTKYTLALLLLTTGGLIIRVLLASDLHLHPWDERYHALVAKNLIEKPLVPQLYAQTPLNFNYEDWTSNHIWLHKQMLPLWSMALSIKLFGINEFAVRLPSIMLSVLAIAIIYDLGRSLFNRRVAFIAAFLLSVQGIVLEVGSGRAATDHVDLHFMFYVLLAVWMAKKYADFNRNRFYLLACGLAIGLAILCKWLPALIVIPILFCFLRSVKEYSWRKYIGDFVLLTIVVLIVCVPWQIYIHSHFPKEAAWESASNFKHLTHVLDRMGGAFYYHFDKMRIQYGEFVYIPIAWFIYRSIFITRKWENFALLIWILIPYLFFSIARTKMQAYTLFTAPAILLICAHFWEYLWTNRKQLRYSFLTWTLLIGLLILPLRYAIERIKPLEGEDQRNPMWAKELKKLRSKSLDDKIIVFNVEHNIELMFYTDVTAYNFIPSNEQITQLNNRGFSCFEFVNGKLIRLKD